MPKMYRYLLPNVFSVLWPKKPNPLLSALDYKLPENLEKNPGVNTQHMMRPEQVSSSPFLLGSNYNKVIRPPPPHGPVTTVDNMKRKSLC